MNNVMELNVLVFGSSLLLCIPVGIATFVQAKLESRARERDNAESERILARLLRIFSGIYLSYFILVVAIAAAVGWSLSDFDYAKLFFLPVAFSATVWTVNGRREKSSAANKILVKVFASYAQYARTTGITGPQLANERIERDWLPFVLFLRSFHLEQPMSNPFLMGLSENLYERMLTRDIETELSLFVLGLGRKEVAEGAARLHLSDGMAMDWKTVVFVLAAAAEAVFVLPSASEGTAWEMNVCLTNFRQKTIFYSPKVDAVLATKQDQALRTEITLMTDALRSAGYEIPALFVDTVFWIYSDDKTFQSFNSAAATYAHLRAGSPAPQIEAKCDAVQPDG